MQHENNFPAKIELFYIFSFSKNKIKMTLIFKNIYINISILILKFYMVNIIDKYKIMINTFALM